MGNYRLRIGYPDPGEYILTAESGSLALAGQAATLTREGAGENAYAMYLNFDAGTTGASIQSYTNSVNGTNGIFSTDGYGGAGKSFSTSLLTGQTGFEEGFGLMVRLLGTNGSPVQLVLGDEIWWRCRIKFSSNYNFDDTDFAQKFFRIKTNAFGQDAVNDGGVGHIDVYIDRPANGDNAFHFVYEGQSPETNQYFGSYAGSTHCIAGEWHTFEVYCKLGTNTSNSKLKFYLDGAKIGESTTIYTLTNSTDFVGALLLFTYYNGGPDRNITINVDDFTVYHTGTGGGGPPNDVDEDDAPFIGVN